MCELGNIFSVSMKKGTVLLKDVLKRWKRKCAVLVLFFNPDSEPYQFRIALLYLLTITHLFLIGLDVGAYLSVFLQGLYLYDKKINSTIGRTQTHFTSGFTGNNIHFSNTNFNLFS